MRLSVIACHAAAGLLMSALPVAAGATVANSGTVNASAYAQASGGPVDQQSATDTAAGLPGMLLAAVTVASTAPDNSTLSARTQSRATWTSADAGTAELALARVFPSVGGVELNNQLNPNWAYDFTATGDGFFNLDYDVRFFGDDPFGITGWDLDVNGDVVLPLQNVFDPTASGSFSYALTAGTRYVFALSNGSNLAGCDESCSDTLLGQFQWNIVGGAVPEPGSWALMITGFGIAGIAMRRRRVAATA